MSNLPILFCELAGNLQYSASKDPPPTPYIKHASVLSTLTSPSFNVQEACEEFLEELERSSTTQAQLQVQVLAASNTITVDQPITDYVTASNKQDWTEVRSTEFLDSAPYHKPTPRYHQSDLQIVEQLGEGGQGLIYDVIRNETSRGVLKLFKTASGSPQGQWPDDILKIENYYLCNLIAYVDGGDGSIGLLMDKYDTDLRRLIDQRLDDQKRRKNTTLNPADHHHKLQGPFSDYPAMEIITCIALGVKALHDHGVTHRDLKASNVLLNVESDDRELYKNIVLTDFEDSSDVVGTMFWRAPEVLQALKDNSRDLVSAIYSPKSDIYSFGMTCYEILTGQIPLESYRKSDYDVVLRDRRRPQLPLHVNPKLASLICRCWHHDPDLRPDSSEVVSQIKQIVEEDESLSHILVHFVYDEVLEGPNMSILRQSDSNPLQYLDELQEKMDSQKRFLSSEGYGAGCDYVSEVRKFIHRFGCEVNGKNAKEAVAMGLRIGECSSKVQVEIMAPRWWNNVSRPLTLQVLKLLFKSGGWIAHVLRLYNKRVVTE